MIGLIPLVCWLFTATGAGGLLWYYNLSDEEKKKADQLAEKAAKEMYDKKVEELEQRQKEQLNEHVRKLLGK